MEVVEDNQQQHVDNAASPLKTDSSVHAMNGTKHEHDPSHEHSDASLDAAATSSNDKPSGDRNDEQQLNDSDSVKVALATAAALVATATAAAEPEASDEPEESPVVHDAATAVTSVETIVTTTETIVTTTETIETLVTDSTIETNAASLVSSTDETTSNAHSDAPLLLSDLLPSSSPTTTSNNHSNNNNDDDDDDAFADALQENDTDSSPADSLEHELQDLLHDSNHLQAPPPTSSYGTGSNGVAPTLNYSVNEMEVITNRGGRAGSLSKFLDDADSYRRRSSLPTYPDDPLFSSGLHHKSMSLAAFLDMGIDPILEILDDTDSDIRLWLLQPQTVADVLAEFITPPVLTGEPHEEYGYYKNHFVCSEIIMKLYTGEEDLYESFSSDSSSGSTATTAVFGCQDASDLAKWAQLYAIFDNPQPLDEMQLLFFSKALVRLHDGFCLEEGYVPNVLRRFLPAVVPHLYSNTVKYMLTLILQSYESVHPITGRNDAMEIVAPLLVDATQLVHVTEQPLRVLLVENTSQLLVDMLQANQADRLGSFCRREGGVYLSKYFVRDQFGTIRGFESMTHGYHNFLQYMLLEECGKHPTIVDDVFTHAHAELTTLRTNHVAEASSSLNVHMATELLLLCAKFSTDAFESDDASDDATDSNTNDLFDASNAARGSSFGYGSFSAEQFASSPRESTTETSMYNLSSLAHGRALWSSVRRAAIATTDAFVAQFDCGLAPSVEIALAKYLHALVALNDDDANAALHASGLIAKYLRVLALRSRFDMLLIHVVPAIAFILRDADGARAKNCPLTKDLFGVDASDDNTPTIVDLILKAKLELPTLRIYSAIIHDVLDEVFASVNPTQNNAQVLFHCKRSSAWAKLTGRTSSSAKARPSDTKRASSDASDGRRSSVASSSSSSSSPPVATAPVGLEAAAAAADEPTSASSIDEEAAVASPTTVTSPLTTETDATDATSSRTSTKLASPPPPPPPTKDVEKDAAAAKEKDAEKDAAPRKSTHYFKNVLQSPVFKSPMRLGAVIKVPERAPSPPESSSNSTDAAQEPAAAPAAARGTFAWNSVFKKLRNSWVATHHSDKSEKKNLLALSNEPFATHALQPRQTNDVLVVDTSRGDDVTKFVHRDGGVHVVDVPLAGAHTALSGSGAALNVVTSGYVYKNKLPETGQRHVWERLYFVLNRADGSLSYYISEAHAKDRTYVRGTARPVSVSEGLPVHVTGQQNVYGFQINTQGHGAFMVLVDSIDTRLVWLAEILACVSAAAPAPGSSKRLSLLGHVNHNPSNELLPTWTKSAMKTLVVEFYQNLFGPNLKFATPLEAPASFWMEEKIDPVADVCVLSSNLPDCVPYWGEFHGYKRLCDYWKIRDETIERSSGRVLRIVVDEDEETAVVMTSTTFRVLRNSQTVTEESCDIVSMSGGSIVSIHCTFDSFRIAEAFRKEGVSAS